MVAARRTAVSLLLTLTMGLIASGCSSPALHPRMARPATPVSAEPRSGQATAPAGSSTAPSTHATPTTADGWETVGTSVQGRPIRARSFGYGPRKVLFIGGIHGDEPEGAYATTQLPAAFTNDGLTGAVTLTILEDANPDGRANGTRGNANGVDINRNFPAANFDTSTPAYGGSPLSQPESRAVYDTIGRIGPDLLPVEESSSFAATPGSLGSYVGRDKTAILTIELLKGSDATADWFQIQTALLHAIAGGA
jgi:murein peptide amidase A